MEDIWQIKVFGYYSMFEISFDWCDWCEIDDWICSPIPNFRHTREDFILNLPHFPLILAGTWVVTFSVIVILFMKSFVLFFYCFGLFVFATCLLHQSTFRTKFLPARIPGTNPWWKKRPIVVQRSSCFTKSCPFA